MPQRLRSYAPYVALAGVAAVIIALGGWLVVGRLVTWIEIVGAAGLVLLAASAIARPDAVGAAATGRRARYGGNAAVMSLAFVSILGMLNYLAVRHPERWDLTEERLFTLSEQTLSILGSLEEPVKVTLFFTPAHHNRVQAEDLIKEYAARSSLLTYEIVDPETQRRLAMQYQVARDGTAVFERGERREVTFGAQEQDLTGALLKVIRDETIGVYFLTGHGERDPESYDGPGYSTMKGVLEAENYSVGTLNLTVTDELPADLRVLVIAGPQQPLQEGELERLQDYIDGGGCALVLVDAGMQDPLDGLTQAYGVSLPDALIIDPAQAFFGDPSTPLVTQYTFHQITKDLTGLSSILPTARPLIVEATPPEDWRVTTLTSSSAQSWAETDYGAEQIRSDEGETPGPLALAVAVEPGAAGGDEEAPSRGRLVIIGDADLSSNEMLAMVRGVANVDLFMNAVGWLAEEEELISIRPKQQDPRQVFLTPAQARAIIYGNILFVPLGVLVAGGVVWWRRR